PTGRGERYGGGQRGSNMNRAIPTPSSAASLPRTPDLARSYRYCERLARREAGNFYHPFPLLPARPRPAMCSLYAFMRVADDLSDGPGDVASKRAALHDWRTQLHQALAGDYTHPLHPAFHHTVARHGIPVEYLTDVLDGVSMDLGPV